MRTLAVSCSVGNLPKAAMPTSPRLCRHRLNIYLRLDILQGCLQNSCTESSHKLAIHHTSLFPIRCLELTIELSNHTRDSTSGKSSHHSKVKPSRQPNDWTPETGTHNNNASPRRQQLLGTCRGRRLLCFALRYGRHDYRLNACD